MKGNEPGTCHCLVEKETFPYQHVFGCVCKCFLISLYVLHGGVWDWGHRFSKPPLLLGRIILRELIWYLALIGPIRAPLFRTIVAGLKLKPSSSSWLAGLITLIKHHFDRIISLFLHIHSPVCHISVFLCICHEYRHLLPYSCSRLFLCFPPVLSPQLIPVSQERRT